jgi:hypothetical protein
METINIPLAYNEGPNKNGFSISKEILSNAFEREQEKIEKGLLSVLPSYLNNIHSWFEIPREDAIGVVKNVDLENLKATIDVQPKFAELQNITCLGLTYIATDWKEEDGIKVINDVNILYSVLMPKESSAYNKGEE